MATSQVVIPIAQALSSCSSAASCSSGASCSASSCGSSANSSDPAFLLQQQGWVLRTTIGEPRLSEVVENYRAMGYEVHVEQFGNAKADSGAKKSDDAESCTVCFDAADRSQASQVWGSVYVRRGQSPDKNDELFR